ncbi:Hsp20 family protein [Candidatus Pacearchaeota archaeon]|nr:Hsp20 family protein [Candidatus Pacearchaeota archaeon]MBD3282757.1 Hsp20 family protein [Candidatus Pacearchaeota archaeon]
MGFFDDDPFEDIVREIFGGSPVRRARKDTFIKGEDEDRVIDFIEDEDKVYLIFELPGYNENDISVAVKGKELEISAKKSNGENIQDYLHQKLRNGISIRKNIPKFINSKKMSHTMRNGVLEVVFNKQGGRNESRKIRIN